MNVYLFYMKENACKDKESLYAFTNNKEISEKFKSQRDMRLFNTKKIKNISKEEFQKLRLSKSGSELIYGHFYTSSDIYGKLINIELLCTFNEEISSIKLHDKIFENAKFLFDGKIFKNRYIRSLDTLLFTRFYTFYKLKFLKYQDQFYNPYYNNFDCDGFLIEDFKSSFAYDDLRLFLKFFGNTFIPKK